MGMIRNKLKVAHVVGVKNGWAIQKRAEALIKNMSDDIDGSLLSYREVTTRMLNEYDFLHIHGLQLLPLLCGIIDKCSTPFGFEVISERSLKRLAAAELLMQKSLVCWCKNPRLIELVRSYLNFDPIYIPNGVDIDLFVSRAMQVGWVGNKRDRHHLVYKGIPLIENAVKQLNENGGNYEFRMDPGNYPTVLTQQELVPYYQSLDVFVCASQAEGCSNVINEALACGVPVVSTRVGNALELEQDGLVVCVDRTPQGIMQGIEYVMKDRIKRAKAIQQYKWGGELIAKKYLESYYQVLGY